MTTTAWLMFSPTETLMTGCWVWPGSELLQVLKENLFVICDHQSAKKIRHIFKEARNTYITN